MTQDEIDRLGAEIALRAAPTPRTDACIWLHKETGEPCVNAAISRQLERELAETKAQLADVRLLYDKETEYRKELEAQLATAKVEFEAMIASAEFERDAALEKLAKTQAQLATVETIAHRAEHRANQSESELATAREDAELLDWLEQYRFENPEECAALVGVWIPTDGSRYPLGLRSAMRSAMKEKAK